MSDLLLWVDILKFDAEKGLYFEALGDLEQVKIRLAEMLKSAIAQYAENAQ